MAVVTVNLRLSLRSRRAVRALAKVVDHITEIVTDQPWNDNAKAALRQLEIMRDNLVVRRK